MTKQDAAQFKVEDWNFRYPVGTEVNVRRDNGSVLRTTTRSHAWILGGTPVVKVHGIAGGYSLDRLSAIS